MPKQQWQPLANGEHIVKSTVRRGFGGDYLYGVAEVNEEQLTIKEGDWGYESITCNLPPSIRLCQLVNVDTPQPMPDALSPEIEAAIGYCWRWVIHYAEKGVGLGPDRREFMEQQASLLCAWLDGLAKEGNE